MQTSLSSRCQRAAIIGLLFAVVVAMTACSALRLGYGQAPQLAHWWLDRYLDFSTEQSPRVKAALEQWFTWHRATQLADYAGLLASVQAQLMVPVTAAQVCRVGDEARARVAPAVERALPLVAELLPTLAPAQLVHLEQRYAKVNDEYRKDHLQPNAEERRQAAVERAVERAESLYGRLDDAQRRLVATSTAESPFDADAWFAEREDRQRDVLRTLRQLVAERADKAQVLSSLRRIARRMDGSATPQSLTQYQCEAGARLHNTTTPQQRAHARNKLRGWEEDLRVLAAGVPGGAGGALP